MWTLTIAHTSVSTEILQFFKTFYALNLEFAAIVWFFTFFSLNCHFFGSRVGMSIKRFSQTNYSKSHGNWFVCFNSFMTSLRCVIPFLLSVFFLWTSVFRAGFFFSHGCCWLWSIFCKHQINFSPNYIEATLPIRADQM